MRRAKDRKGRPLVAHTYARLERPYTSGSPLQSATAGTRRFRIVPPFWGLALIYGSRDLLHPPGSCYRGESWQPPDLPTRIISRVIPLSSWPTFPLCRCFRLSSIKLGDHNTTIFFLPDQQPWVKALATWRQRAETAKDNCSLTPHSTTAGA